MKKLLYIILSLGLIMASCGTSRRTAHVLTITDSIEVSLIDTIKVSVVDTLHFSDEIAVQELVVDSVIILAHIKSNDTVIVKDTSETIITELVFNGGSVQVSTTKNIQKITIDTLLTVRKDTAIVFRVDTVLSYRKDTTLLVKPTKEVRRAANFWRKQLRWRMLCITLFLSIITIVLIKLIFNGKK